MRHGLLVLLMGPAAVSSSFAVTVGGSQTLEALQAQAVQAPEMSGRGEDAARRAGQGFEGNPFHISTLQPVEHVDPAALRRVEAPVAETQPAPRREGPLPTAPAEVPPSEGGPQRSPTNNYYFEGKSPVSGITIYTAKPDLTGGGRTGSEGPDNPYGKYGKWGLIGGAALIVGAFLLGGPAGIALGVLGGVALGIGGLITFLFGRKR
jgi:hypothetical protein